MWNLLAMGSSYQRRLEEEMKTGFSAVQLFQDVQEERLNDAKYQGPIFRMGEKKLRRTSKRLYRV